MCGIAGIYGQPKKIDLEKMLNAQKHRGPDGRDIWQSSDGKIMIGHDRLAIVDVTGGKQPIANENETLHVVVNGEIYNHLKLHQSLHQVHKFRTKSDSEIVLHLYEEYGPAAIQMLDGMFAIALWSNQNGLLLARDPIGIKPLYYGFDDFGTLFFGSEIKALLGFVKKIEEFPPGSYWEVGKDVTHYYHIPDPRYELMDETTTLPRLKETLITSVQKRLMADVPLGTFLSGGLDSSLITAIVKQFTTTPLHTFSVGLENSPDILNAREVARYLGTIHHEKIITADEILRILPQIIYLLESYDPALVRSAIPTFFVSELASKYVKVVLSGEGADELFAGYHYLEEMHSDYGKLSQELYHITSALHNSNLQRVDRMTMANGLEGRVPFLDKKMIEIAFLIHPLLNIKQNSKLTLRKIAEEFLPPPIVWRKKEKFATGTGIGAFLEKYANQTISDGEFREAAKIWNRNFGNKEELFYWFQFSLYYNRNDIIGGTGLSRSLNETQPWMVQNH